VRNCFSCALASDQGNVIKCGFKPKKLLDGFPFYPVFMVNARTMPVQKLKIPAKDCPAFKPKPAEKAKGA
jgi:hypothetical protein